MKRLSAPVCRDRPTLLSPRRDYDPSGSAIFTQLAEDVAAFAERDGFGEVQSRGAGSRSLPSSSSSTTYQTAPPNLNQHASDVWAGETCQLEAMARLLNALSARRHRHF